MVDAEKEHKESSSSRTGFEPQKLNRIPGPPSSLPPPADAPAWTLKEHATPSGLEYTVAHIHHDVVCKMV